MRNQLDARTARRAPPGAARAAGGVFSALLLASAVGLSGGQMPAFGTAPGAQAVMAENQAPTSAAAMVSRPDGTDLVFYRGQDDGLYFRSWSGAGWSAQSSLGGILVGAPAAATAGGDVLVAGRGTDGALWTKMLVDGGWQSWQSLGGIVSAAPAVTGTAAGRFDVFVRGNDNRLYTRSRVPGQAWTPWSSLSGTLTSGPGAVAFDGDRVDVVVAGTDHAIWHGSRTSAGWSGWHSLGGGTYTAPAIARIAGTDLARVFVRGTTDYLYANQRTANGWSGWSSLGGVLVDAPAATGTPTGAHVVVRGTDSALYARSLVGNAWTPFVRAWVPVAPDPPTPGLKGVDWTRVPTAARVIALTFDAGANADGLAAIRTTLQRKNVPATFFLTGSWTRTYRAQANEIAVGGYRIANHSDTHPHFPSLPDAQVQAQVRSAERTILLTNGADARPLFRFPFGDVDTRVLGLVNNLDYVAVRWTVDSLGWQGTSGGMTAQKVLDRVLANAQPGAIVLMHVGSNPDDRTTLDADALSRVVDGLRARGYSFVTLEALTG